MSKIVNVQKVNFRELLISKKVNFTFNSFFISFLISPTSIGDFNIDKIVLKNESSDERDVVKKMLKKNKPG